MEIKVKRTNAQNPSPDELYHWKYIKRERINGKWRYYYDVDQLKDDIGITAREEMNKALTTQKQAETTLRNSNRKVNLAVEDHRSYDKQSRKNNNFSKSKDRQLRSVVDKTLNDYYKDLDKRNNARTKTLSAMKKYNSTPLGKLEKSYENVKRKIKNLFD